MCANDEGETKKTEKGKASEHWVGDEQMVDGELRNHQKPIGNVRVPIGVHHHQKLIGNVYVPIDSGVKYMQYHVKQQQIRGRHNTPSRFYANRTVISPQIYRPLC